MKKLIALLIWFISLIIGIAGCTYQEDMFKSNIVENISNANTYEIKNSRNDKVFVEKEIIIEPETSAIPEQAKLLQRG